MLEILSGDSTCGAILRFQSGTTVVPGNGLGLWKEVPWMQHGAGHGETAGGGVRLHKYPPGNDHIAPTIAGIF